MPPITLAATAPDEPFRLGCRHIFTDGHRCGSPALRHADFCYYHHKARRPGPRQPQVSQSATPLRAAKLATFDLPSPADLAERSGLALAIGQIMHKIAHNELDPRRAGLLLYAIQIASGNLPKAPALNNIQPATTLRGPLVDSLDPDPLHGPLRPEAEWEEPEPPSAPSGRKTISNWLKNMQTDEEAAEEDAQEAADQAAT